MKKKKCKECGKRKDVYEDSGLCEDCESNLDYCQICDEWQDTHWGNGCRHLQWSSFYGMMGGSGSCEGVELAEDQLPALLDCMGDEFAKNLLIAIETEDFFFQYHGSMLGPVEVEMKLGKVQSLHGFDVSKKINTMMEKDDKKGQLAAEGVQWLISLWANKEDSCFTGDANKATAKIIKDWIHNNDDSGNKN